MNVIKLEGKDFQDTISKATKPIVVDFYADWCGPCKMIAPVLEELASENSDIQIFKINIDENQDIAGKYSVMSIPTLISFKDGKEYKRNVGALPKPSILELTK